MDTLRLCGMGKLRGDPPENIKIPPVTMIRKHPGYILTDKKQQTAHGLFQLDKHQIRSGIIHDTVRAMLKKAHHILVVLLQSKPTIPFC